MIKPLLTKLKIFIKRLVGKCVYAGFYCKNSLIPMLKKTVHQKNKDKPKHRKNIFNLIALVAERWKTVLLILTGFFALYYGGGAAVSSQINNNLAIELKPSNSARYLPQALTHVLKTQVDDSAWTPALPVIFPAAVTDNLPNFQLGVKDSTAYLVKQLAAYYNDKNLKDAAVLLNYPPHIWLFSQTGDDNFAPGSARQYRKALSLIQKFGQSPADKLKPNSQELSFILNKLNNLLTKQLDRLNKHVIEHNTDMVDNKADDIFYQTKGNIYTVYYVLTALVRDYQNIIVEKAQYENVTTALNYLNRAETFKPFIIKNAAPEDSFTANHLLYLAYYISRAQNYIQTINADLSPIPLGAANE